MILVFAASSGVVATPAKPPATEPESGSKDGARHADKCATQTPQRCKKPAEISDKETRSCNLALDFARPYWPESASAAAKLPQCMPIRPEQGAISTRWLVQVPADQLPYVLADNQYLSTSLNLHIYIYGHPISTSRFEHVFAFVYVNAYVLCPHKQKYLHAHRQKNRQTNGQLDISVYTHI